MKHDQENKAPLQKLSQAYHDISPHDSWEALQGRIQQKLAGRTLPAMTRDYEKQISRWRRIACGLAACLLAVLTYLCLSRVQPPQPNRHSALDLLIPRQMDQLQGAFVQIQDLFTTDIPWVVMSPSGAGEIGTETSPDSKASRADPVVIRLALAPHNRPSPQYYDVVARLNSQVAFQIPLHNHKVLHITLKPRVIADSHISVEMAVQMNDQLHLTRNANLPPYHFEPLLDIPMDGHRLELLGTAQRATNL